MSIFNKHFLIVLVTFFSLVSELQSYNVDTNKVRRLDVEHHIEFYKTQGLKINWPFAVHFKNDHNELLYLAVMHSITEKSHTFQMIKHAIEQFRPDLIILEGIPTALGVSYPVGNDPGETGYSGLLASANGIDYVGAFPELDILLKHLRKTEWKGFSSTSEHSMIDMCFYRFTFMIPQFVRKRGLSSEADLQNIFLEWFGGSEYTFYDYTMWLRKKLHKDVPFNDLMDGYFFAPSLYHNDYLQNLMNLDIWVRDTHALELIMQSLSKYKKVLVVFGSAHYITQKDVLVENLGQPFYMSSEQFIHVCRSANNKQ